MNSSPQDEFRPQSAVKIAAIIVVNIIWWMVMIAAIGLGAINLGSCPVQPNIPIYLIVLGSASLASLSLTYTKRAYDDGCACILISFSMALLHFFTFCWFIAGIRWIFPVYPPSYTPGTARYCQRITYEFAFIVTILLCVVTALSFICTCCFCMVTCCKTRRRLIPSRYSFYGATSASEESTAGDV